LSVISRTVWFIESHLDDDLSLASLSAEAGVSAPHLARRFASETGLPVMRYVWRRRLARAAQDLARGGQTVLTIALAAGYTSHEAFSRAFRAEFGLSPRMMQAMGDPAIISALQPKEFYMPQSNPLPTPRLVPCKARHFVGLDAGYTHATKSGIPQQWERFNTADPDIDNTLGEAAFGVIHGFADDGSWRYACAYEVSKAARATPDDYIAMSFPARTYAVFSVSGHVTTIDTVIGQAMEWVAGSDYSFDDGPTLERYGDDFDPETGTGGFEVWVAVVPR
jgi:AraC family transcriptional regulator